MSLIILKALYILMSLLRLPFLDHADIILVNLWIVLEKWHIKHCRVLKSWFIIRHLIFFFSNSDMYIQYDRRTGLIWWSVKAMYIWVWPTIKNSVLYFELFYWKYSMVSLYDIWQKLADITCAIFDYCTMVGRYHICNYWRFANMVSADQGINQHGRPIPHVQSLKIREYGIGRSRYKSAGSADTTCATTEYLWIWYRPIKV